MDVPCVGAGETAQQFGESAALSENPGFVPTILGAPYNCLKLQFQEIRYPLSASVGTRYTDIHGGKDSNT